MAAEPDFRIYCAALLCRRQRRRANAGDTCGRQPSSARSYRVQRVLEDDRTPEESTRERAAREELHDLYLVGVGTLLRQMNLVMLRRKEWDGTRLRVQTKTGPHMIALDGPTALQTRAAAVLERRKPAARGGAFFPIWHARFERDRNATSAKFLVAFRRACARAEIPWGLQEHGVVWHTATRASGATRLLREFGIDIRTVQLLGGWSSLDSDGEYLGVDVASAPASTKKKAR